ncbi:MAG: TonB-dependent receptor plug domain-containing protein [Nitrosomonas ureae]
MKTSVVSTSSWFTIFSALCAPVLFAGDHSFIEPPINTPTKSSLVLTPSRLPQPLNEAASTITVIDRAMIEASGARRLIDVLRLVPGFSVGTKTNSLPTATYHGLSDEYARRTLLLVTDSVFFNTHAA